MHFLQFAGNYSRSNQWHLGAKQHAIMNGIGATSAQGIISSENISKNSSIAKLNLMEKTEKTLARTLRFFVSFETRGPSLR